jgi:hypothetical protein
VIRGIVEEDTPTGVRGQLTGSSGDRLEGVCRREQDLLVAVDLIIAAEFPCVYLVLPISYKKR